MSHRYMIRIYEDCDNNGATGVGTVTQLVNREMCIYAYSADETEKKLRADVAAGKLPAGRVYQICPWMANLELIRSFAASLDGSFQRVFLDPAAGLYSEFRQVRLPELFSGAGAFACLS